MRLLLSTIRSEWRFDKTEGWTLRVRLFNAFYLIAHALLPRPLARRVTDAVRK